MKLHKPEGLDYWTLVYTLEDCAYISKTSLYLIKLNELVMHKVQHNKTMNMEAIELPYIKLLPTACTPTCATPKSIGLDLYSPTSVLVLAHDKVLINRGIAFQIPMGYYGQIAPRSGLALHHHIHVDARVVDPNYIGPVQVLLLNFSQQNHTIESESLHSPINSGKKLPIQSFVRCHKYLQQSVAPTDLIQWGNK